MDGREWRPGDGDVNCDPEAGATQGDDADQCRRAQSRQKLFYDRGTSHRTLAPGEKVLILLPNPHHSLKLEWFGPYQVQRQVTLMD